MCISRKAQAVGFGVGFMRTIRHDFKWLTDASRTGARQIWFDGKWWDSPVYDRLSLPVGAEVPGPAVLEQADTTILVDPDLTGTVDSYGNFVIARKA